MASLLHQFIEFMVLVAWRLLPIITIPGISYRKCHFSARFGTGHYIYWWITQKVVSIYITLNLICIRKIVLLLESWAKSSNLNLFFYAFLHIFCVINITVQWWCCWLNSAQICQVLTLMIWAWLKTVLLKNRIQSCLKPRVSVDCPNHFLKMHKKFQKLVRKIEVLWWTFRFFLPD